MAGPAASRVVRAGGGHRAHRPGRLPGPRGPRRSRAGADPGPRRGGRGGHDLGAAWPWGCRVPCRHQVGDGAHGGVGHQVRRVQRRRGRLGDVRRPDAHRGGSVHADRGDGDRGGRHRGHRGLRLPAQRVPARGAHAAAGDRHRLRPRGAGWVGARQRPPVRPRRARRGGGLHLRRGDLDARLAGGQAGRGAGQATDPRAARAVRAADRGQQRAHPRRGPHGAGRGWRGVRLARHRPLAGNAGVPAGRQRGPRRHRRDGVRHRPA